MEPLTSNRGFDYFEPFVTEYGHKIQVHESSSVEPSIWVRMDAGNGTANGDAGKQAALLSIEQAKHLRDCIDWLLGNYPYDPDEG